ncbi:MAG: hypothetical protein QM680_12705 [Luteolibacter sp.]
MREGLFGGKEQLVVLIVEIGFVINLLRLLLFAGGNFQLHALRAFVPGVIDPRPLLAAADVLDFIIHRRGEGSQ